MPTLVGDAQIHACKKKVGRDKCGMGDKGDRSYKKKENFVTTNFGTNSPPFAERRWATWPWMESVAWVPG